jgi:hypothetical protein
MTMLAPLDYFLPAFPPGAIQNIIQLTNDKILERRM